MAKSSSSINGADKDYTVLVPNQTCTSSADNVDNYCFDDERGYPTSDNSADVDAAAGFMRNLEATRNSNNDDTFADKTQDIADGTGLFVDVMVQGIMNDLLHSMSKEGNPMVLAENLGHNIIWGVELAFTLALVTTTALAIGLGTGACVNPGFLILAAALAFIIPMFLPLCMYLLAIGGTLAVVLPMIPATVYFLAIIGWLVSVIETMIAAPIVAIGVLHPEGHPVWGKAEPAIMLLANMFLRPSLIVIGMAAGVILSFISLQVINFGFENAMNLVLDDKKPTAMELIIFLGMYVGLVVAAVNKSFSLISHIPEKCMRWIQGGEATQFGGHEDAMGKVQEQTGKGESAAREEAGEMNSASGRAKDLTADTTKKIADGRDAKAPQGGEGEIS